MKQPEGAEPGSLLTQRRLAILVTGCLVFVLLSSFAFQSFVMPQLDDEGLALANRIRSPKFGDSYGYGRYSEGILLHRRLSDTVGEPILKHVPGLPLLVAVAYGATGSVQPFLAFQILFFFAALYCFLARARAEFPAIAIAATPILIALHPQTIKHSAAVMSDLMFGAMLLWVCWLLLKSAPRQRDFVWAGVVFGLAVYVREAALPFMLVTGIAYLLKDFRKYLRPALLMACTFLVLLAPWMARNYRLTHELIPLTTKSSDLFYYSSIPLTTETYSPLGPGLQEGGYAYDEIYEVYDRETRRWGDEPVAAVSQAGDRAQQLFEQFHSWADRPLPANPIEEGLRNYYSRPGEQAVSLLLKSIALFNKPPILAHLSETSLAGLLVAGNVVFHVFHMGVILMGVMLSFSRRHGPLIFLPYWIGAQYLQSLFFWSEYRYLMPFYPLLILIALSWYWSRWEGGLSANTRAAWGSSSRCSS